MKLFFAPFSLTLCDFRKKAVNKRNKNARIARSSGLDLCLKLTALLLDEFSEPRFLPEIIPICNYIYKKREIPAYLNVERGSKH